MVRVRTGKLRPGGQSPVSQPRAESIASLNAALTAATGITPDDRPHMRVIVQSGASTEALYDTGSAVTAVSEKFFQNMISRAKHLPFMSEMMRVSTVDGTPLPIKGCYEAEVWLEGQWRKGNFFVMPELTSDMLLGIDFIKAHKLGYEASKHRIRVEEDQENLVTCKETRIPVGSIRKVRVKSPTLKATEGEITVASIRSTEVPICGTDMIVEAHQGGYYILLDNVMDAEIRIPRGAVVGTVEKVKEEQCTKLELEMDAKPKEDLVAKGTCEPEKEAMLREVLNEQLRNMDKETAEKYLEAILENHDVFSKDKSDLGRTTVMEHKIRLKDDAPAYNKQFRIPEEHQSILIEHLQNWLKLGVVSPCKSHWNSPIFLVPKKDGSMRPVLDFLQVNKQSHIDKYSQREIQDCLDEIGRNESTIFSSLDLTAGFWQLPLAEDSREMTAFTIPGMGSYCWNMTPMGLLGSPATFGRMMDFIMRFLKVITYRKPSQEQQITLHSPPPPPMHTRTHLVGEGNFLLQI